MVLVFVSPSCGPCHQLVPDLAQWQDDLAADVTVALITERALVPDASKFDTFRNVLLDDRKAVAEAYHITGTPSAVVILPTGHIGTSVLNGPEAIRRHIAATFTAGQRTNQGDAPALLIERPRAEAQLVGLRLPDLSLPTSTGELLSIVALRGINTVFVFWNPRCGFCQEMISELAGWERENTGKTPRLVIVSSEPPGLGSMRSTVLIDGDFRFGGACGISGTPSALATDSEGLVVEPVALGSKSILELLRRAERRNGRREVHEALSGEVAV